ncbi:stalk domain-containing protein [Cohnella sp.]|uniref:stalk domain-containing protein n=1 Tax=Cohnella sp. TaxID=1883426 RepID=UPI00356B6188
MKKTALSLMLAGFALSSALPAYAATNAGSSQGDLQVQFTSGLKSYVDSTGKHSLQSAPYITSGTLMAPLKALTNGLGAGLKWNASKKQLEVTKSGVVIIVKPGSDQATLSSGKASKLAARVVILDNHAFVPAASLSRLLGVQVLWNNSVKRLTLKKTSVDNGVKPIHFSYDLNTDAQGWTAGFADLPVDYDKEIYNLDGKRALLPVNGNKTDYGFMLSGHNRSDDLFMFMTKKIEGLQPNTKYDARLLFDMYTNEAGGQMGIGGAPAESIFLKAGITSQAPKAVVTGETNNAHYAFNLDKGNQSTEGADLKLLGTIAKPDDKEGYQKVKFNYAADITTNAKGELYLTIGTDSGFEGLTALYFDNIQFNVTRK